MTKVEMGHSKKRNDNNHGEVPKLAGTGLHCPFSVAQDAQVFKF